MNADVGGQADLTPTPGRAESLPSDTGEPRDAVYTVMTEILNDLTVIRGALELVQARADLPGELRTIVCRGMTRSTAVADRVRTLAHLVTGGRAV
jgi:hypothetical protein